jgi:hypothetical protein
VSLRILSCEIPFGIDLRTAIACASLVRDCFMAVYFYTDKLSAESCMMGVGPSNVRPSTWPTLSHRTKQLKLSRLFLYAYSLQRAWISATGQKVPGSIPGRVTGDFFPRHLTSPCARGRLSLSK